MTRLEYLETVNGQRHERLKRVWKSLRLDVNQEPKGKNSSAKEKSFFVKR